MTIPQIPPPEAHRLMGEGHTYLDVRSVTEFDQGHPEGALNIPLLHADPARGMVPNHDFMTICQANLPPDSKLVVGCAVGHRSQMACELLAAQGYTILANIEGGFTGARNPMGQVMAKGWTDHGLPTTAEVPEGTSYAALAARASAQ